MRILARCIGTAAYYIYLFIKYYLYFYNGYLKV